MPARPQVPPQTGAKPALTKAQKAFVAQMHKRHGFDSKALETALARPPRADVLRLISKPAEKAKPWYEYRAMLVQPARVEAGIAFWREHAQALEKAEKTYGVPASIICGIIGVETYFGRIKGKIPVLDSLNTLAFHYPPRAEYFRSELEAYLLLARAEAWPVSEPTGSYAGAMGFGQFMPSNYRKLAIDFDGDQHIDLVGNPVDAIGSVARYLAHHGWEPGAPLFDALPKARPASWLSRSLKPHLTPAALKAAGLPDARPAAYLELETGAKTKGQWLSYQNFYVITRYNRSHMYAMAVAELAGRIESGYKTTQDAAKKK
ncbi:MAG: lytic murein transglycosylase B [Gammaproteobacteria bacterium]|nr:lytic murein transglycosylase B [Gammaproteobacteria bacterium]